MRYQYTSRGFQGYTNNISFQTPDGIKMLIVLNIFIFILVELSGFRLELIKFFGLSPYLAWHSFYIWQPLTYVFLHDGLFHIFVNMIVLWMFGRELELELGKIKFIKYYLYTGIGSGIVTVIFTYNSIVPIVGASGAVYGILMAYALFYPNRTIYLYGLIPFQVKYLVMLIGTTALIASIAEINTSISHLTHLSGMLVGFILLRKNFIYHKINSYLSQIKIIDKKETDTQNKNNKIDSDIDTILDKLKKEGWDGLTQSEKMLLFNVSKHYSEDQPPN